MPLNLKEKESIIKIQMYRIFICVHILDNSYISIEKSYANESKIVYEIKSTKKKECMHFNNFSLHLETCIK